MDGGQERLQQCRREGRARATDDDSEEDAARHKHERSSWKRKPYRKRWARCSRALRLAQAQVWLGAPCEVHPRAKPNREEGRSVFPSATPGYFSAAVLIDRGLCCASAGRDASQS
jgi:hypothetical protein